MKRLRMADPMFWVQLRKGKSPWWRLSWWCRLRNRLGSRVKLQTRTGRRVK